MRCSAILSGQVDTTRIRGYFDAHGGEEAVVDLHPMGRLGRPREIASLVLFLLSDDTGFIPGAEYAVDGGCPAV